MCVLSIRKRCSFKPRKDKIGDIYFELWPILYNNNSENHHSIKVFKYNIFKVF